MLLKCNTPDTLSCVLRLIFVVLIEVFVTLFVVRSPSHVPIIDIKCPMAADPDWTRAPAQY